MFHDFLDLLYPRVCVTCEAALLKHEKLLCTSCLHELPIADFHLQKENAVEKIFYGRIPVENAVSLLLFEKKGMVQKLIHDLKYKGHEEIGEFLGAWLGAELSKNAAFNDISAVLPVPLHKSRLKKRGYNQVTRFGSEIAKALKVPFYEDILLKVSGSQTQTIKKRIARWGKIEETFVLQNPETIKNSHILLVDDLVTTGATLEACAHKLFEAEGVKLSFATIAVTH